MSLTSARATRSTSAAYLAQFRTGSHWLNIKTGRHKDIPRSDRSCPACSHRCVNPGLPADQIDSFNSDEESMNPVEDEHHVIFDCPSYTYARQLFPDIFGNNIVTFSQFLNLPDCDRVAKFLTWIRLSRMNLAESDGSARPQPDFESHHHHQESKALYMPAKPAYAGPNINNPRQQECQSQVQAQVRAQEGRSMQEMHEHVHGKEVIQ